MRNAGRIYRVWHLRTERPESALAKRGEYLEAIAQQCGETFDRFTAELIFTELVGNVIRHSRGPIEISMRCLDGYAQLNVEDSGRGFEYRPQLPADPLSDNGRGLYLISRYAKTVRVKKNANAGTIVTALFPLKKTA